MPNGARETTSCEICGAEFEYWPSEKPGFYCPDCVQNESWRTVPDPPEGEKNVLWKGGKIEKPCAVCGETIERYPSDFGGDIAVCSESCRRSWLSETFTGEGHPNWEGGPIGPYGNGWATVRQQALERDEYTCQVWGTTKADLGRKPDVHHIKPVRSFDRPADAHFLENVISLCIECHRKADFGRIPPEALRRQLP